MGHYPQSTWVNYWQMQQWWISKSFMLMKKSNTKPTVSFIWHLPKGNATGTEVRAVVPKGCRWGQGVNCSGYKGNCWDDGNTLYLDCGYESQLYTFIKIDITIQLDLMNYGMRFVTLYSRQGSRPSPWNHFIYVQRKGQMIKEKSSVLSYATWRLSLEVLIKCFLEKFQFSISKKGHQALCRLTCKIGTVLCGWK